MDAATWTAIGVLTAALVGLFVFVGSGFNSLNARIDALGASLNARIDALGASLNARIDTLDAKIDTLSARLEEHVRHAG